MKFLNQQQLESFENDRSIYIDTTTKTLGIGGKISLFKNNDITSFKTTIRASNSLAADYTITLPPNPGISNQILATDGTGNLSFISSGTVYSVSGTGTVSGLSLSGTVINSGDLTLSGTLEVVPSNFSAQTANKVLAGPTTGSDAAPTFRSIVAADIPTLNQDTTGSAGSVAAANLTGATLASGVTGSSLTSVGTLGGVTVGGDITITGTARRIKGDFSNATHANRVALQTSVTDGATSPFLLPNGTSGSTQWVMASASDPTNSSYLSVGVFASLSQTRIYSGILGTGTFLPIAFHTSDNERMRIDTSGNIGIGTSSPNTTSGKAVHLYNDANTGTVASNSIITIESLNRNAVLELVGFSGSSNQVAFSSPRGTVYSAIVGDATNSALLFRTGGTTERMRIDSSGNVGIGTTNPTYNLDVTGSFRVLGNTIDIGANNSSNTIINVGGTPTGNKIAATDYIGDTTYTDYGLRVGRSNNGANGTSLIQHRGTGDLKISVAEAGYMHFDTTDTERMRISATGNVGIGTNAPSYLLDISGSARVTTAIGIGTAPTSDLLTLGAAGGTNAAIVFNGSTSGSVTVKTAVTAGTWSLTLPTSGGTNGYLLSTDGSGVTSWITPPAAGVTNTSVVSANGFAGTVATSTSTPAITISTTITGLLKGNGTAISAATAGTDYQSPIGTITGLAKGNGANTLTSATAGTDYQSPIGTITGLAKGNGANALTSATAGTDYIAPYGSTTQNYVLASPNGSAGTPTFRALVTADIPAVNNLSGGTLGAVPYQSSANSTTFLSGNTTATPNFVTSTGTGSAAQAPTLTSSTGSGNVVLATSPQISTSITTDTTGTFSLVNTTATTVNFAGAATSLSIAADNTAGGTYNFATGVTASGSTKAINIGTNSASGSTTTITIGATSGTSTIAVKGKITATGSVSTDTAFFENSTTITADYSIASGKNAGTFGPVTINSGITVTIPSGSVWSVV